MKQYKFYKEPDLRWYIDLPEWTGDKAELEMIAGADAMLDIMANSNTSINLLISETEFENSDRLEFIKEDNNWIGGAFYNLEKHKGIEYKLSVWLCDVTKFVFGYFPKNIYLSVIED